MINKENCILLGILSKPYGTKGSLLIRFSGLKVADIKKRELLFVEVDGLPVPFFIEQFQEKSEESAILKFEGIDTEEKAREFLGYTAYVMKDQVKIKPVKGSQQKDISGYRISDEQLGVIGTAGEILDIANNPLLTVMVGDKEMYIPFHEDIILEINDREKLILIRAPEGLFEL